MPSEIVDLGSVVGRDWYNTFRSRLGETLFLRLFRGDEPLAWSAWSAFNALPAIRTGRRILYFALCINLSSHRKLAITTLFLSTCMLTAELNGANKLQWGRFLRV